MTSEKQNEIRLCPECNSPTTKTRIVFQFEGDSYIQGGFRCTNPECDFIFWDPT